MIPQLVDWLLLRFHVYPWGPWYGILSFFLVDTIKIFCLLFVMIAVIGFLRTYLPQKTITRWMHKTPEGVGHAIASLFGAVTPFCSCSSIPLFYGFVKGGIPLGISFSFLITSPIVNEYLFVLMFGLFGWKVAVTYVLFGILIGTICGVMLGRMKLERYLAKDLVRTRAVHEIRYPTIQSRIGYGLSESVSIVKKLWLWIILAVLVGAFIHNEVPEETIHSLVGAFGVFSVPAATIIGVPLYGSCAAIVPVAVVLFQKGVPLGTALSFMMAVSALSLPEAIMLRRAMSLKLIGIFFGIVTLGIIVIGYVFNALQPVLS